MAISRKGRRTFRTHLLSNTCQRWLTAEKSPAKEIITIVRVMRRDEGVPPYRRLHRESDTIKALSLRAKRGNLPEGKTDVPDTLTLQYSPAVAHRREIPRKRNKNNCTRLPRILARGGSRRRSIRRYSGVTRSVISSISPFLRVKSKRVAPPFLRTR